MELNVVGKRINRIDALSKVKGEAIYPQDIFIEGMLYGKTVRSKKPHGNIRVNVEDAEKVNGVVKVFTSVDVPNNTHGVVIKDQEVFCSQKVRRIGDPIALVVGIDERACVEGCKKIKVEYEELEGVFDPLVAKREKSPKVHGDTNIVYHYKLRKGNVEDGFKKCHTIVENIYKTNMQEHAFLQPEAGVAEVDEDGVVTIYVATQYPHYDREEISSSLNIPLGKVRVVTTNVGGAFGGREDISLQIHLALAALTLKRPIKVVYTREESFVAHAKRHSMIMKYKTGADKFGYLQAMEAEIIGDTGAYASWAINVLRKAGVHATGPYYIPNVKVDSIAVYTNNPFAGAMRGFGATQVPIAYEQQIDIIGERLGLDPVTIRMNNILKKGSETATGQILTESVPLDRCIEEVVNSFPLFQRYEEGLK